MNTLSRKFAVTLPIALAVVAALSLPAVASNPQPLLLAPEHDDCLPQFGFASFNIAGVGERITNVRWGGLASRIGLEPGDLILSMNGYRLNYHGSWNDALSYAVANGGWVQLRIRDVRTGFVAYRETFVGGSGPIVGPVTPKIHVGGYRGPVTHYRHQGGHMHGPVTPKSNPAGHNHNDLNNTIKKIATLFD
jgi:hypothetical protein